MPKKFIKSFKYAKSGAEHAIKTQRNLWIHFVIGLVVLSFAIWLELSLFEIAILCLAVFSVIITEIINTAIEELVNILSPQQQRGAALAKNIAAAAVLLAAAGAIVVGCLIFIPKLI